jgi:hypothetical protein
MPPREHAKTDNTFSCNPFMETSAPYPIYGVVLPFCFILERKKMKKSKKIERFFFIALF